MLVYVYKVFIVTNVACFSLLKCNFYIKAKRKTIKNCKLGQNVSVC